jgi:hypothetical protein
MNKSLWFLMIIALIAMVALVGCGKKEAPKPVEQAAQPPPPPPLPAIADVVLAKGFDAGWNAVNPTTTFKPTDRINALVKTIDAVPGNKVAATWWYLKTNQLIKSDTLALVQTGANNTEFFIERAKGWPAGDYRLDVALNGGVPRSATFTVK